MRISIFGLGGIGSTMGACLAEMSHHVIGVDADPARVRMINAGKSPFVEPELESAISRAVKSGRFSATADWAEAMEKTELALVCVGTPGLPNGSINLQALRRACEQIGRALAKRSDYFTVVIRSTVLPGTTEQTAIPVLEKFSGKKAGRDFGLCMSPDFTREGNSVHDFWHPSKTVIGELDSRSGDTLAKLYRKIPGVKIRTDLRTAEMVKYTDNAFHALKAAFANEIGGFCRDAGVDGHHVMDIICRDTTSNLSPRYLKPGFAFGGSCLPKDLRALLQRSKSRGFKAPLLGGILASNNHQIENLTRKLLAFKGRSFGFLGVSFKDGTDDLRGSAMVEIIKTLLRRKQRIKIRDRYVIPARLTGANKGHANRELPDLEQLMCRSAKSLVDESDILIISHRNAEFRSALRRARKDQVIFDLRSPP